MTQALYDFSRKLSGAYGLENVLTATASQLHASLSAGALMLVPDQTGDLKLEIAWPPDLAIGETEMIAARWAFEKKEAAGHLTGTLPQIDFIFRPILSAQRVVGVVGLHMPAGREPFSDADERMIAAMIEQAAVAIDRAGLVRERARAAVEKEGEKLQVALLSSLSHDLRTPLASISGAVSSLRQLGDRMTPETRADLLGLDRGGDRASQPLRRQSLRHDPHRVGHSQGQARAVRSGPGDHRRHRPRQGGASRPDGGNQHGRGIWRWRRAIAALVEQVLFNLLDNARKYAGPELPVSVFARTGDGVATISVTDQGKGIPAQDLEVIFGKFYRRAKGDGRPAGTGLGLSIARGFIEAMGGTIKAESPAVRKRGTRFTVRMPLAVPGDKP